MDASFAASMFTWIVDCILLATETNLTKLIAGNFLIQHLIRVKSDPLLADQLIDVTQHLSKHFHTIYLILSCGWNLCKDAGE